MLVSVIAPIGIGFFSYLFLFSGWHKLCELNAFTRSISDYELAPASWSPALARGLMVTEFALGLGLLIALTRTPALILSVALLSVYTLAIAINIFRGRRDLNCGCSGPGGEQPIGDWLLGRNLLIIALGIFSMTVLVDQHQAVLWQLTLPGAVITILLYHIFNQLHANRTLLLRIKTHG
jgi:uncharacterized membrane protein YphA (DoxX/SURF4 family)